MSVKESKIGQIISLFPLFGVFIVFYGTVKAIRYYDQFNVDVFSYMTFSELITYFLRDVLKIVLFFVIYLIASLAFKPGQNKIEEPSSEEKIKGHDGNSSLKKPFYKTESFFKLMLFLGSILGLFLISWLLGDISFFSK